MRLTSLLVISALSSLNHVSHAFPLKPQAAPNQPAVRRRVAYSVVAVDGASAATPLAALTLLQTSDSIETISVPASSAPPSVDTIVATKVVSELEPAKTVIITLTQEVTITPSPTMIPTYIVVNPVETPILSSTKPLTGQAFSRGSSLRCETPFSTSTLVLSSTSNWTSVPTVSMPMASSDRAYKVAHPAEAEHPAARGPETTASISSSPSPPPPAITSSSVIPKASTKTYSDRMWNTSYTMWNATSSVLSSASATAVGIGRAQNFWKKG